MGEGISALFHIQSISQRVRPAALLGIVALIGFIFSIFYYAPALDKELMNQPRLTGFSLRATAGKLRVLDTMNQYAGQTSWIMTDMPMYAFRVGRPVPPNLATFSQKRLSTGSLTETDILDAMREYQPEQVLIARFAIPALEEYLQENYTQILSAEYFRLFLRSDLAPVAQ